MVSQSVYIQFGLSTVNFGMFCKIQKDKLTLLRLNKLSPHYVMEEFSFSFGYFRLCDLDIPREKWLNYL